MTLEMEKYFRRGPSEEMRKLRANRVLELNIGHSAVKALLDAYSNDKDKAAKQAKVMFTLAAMMAGLEIEDPASFVTLVGEMF